MTFTTNHSHPYYSLSKTRNSKKKKEQTEENILSKKKKNHSSRLCVSTCVKSHRRRTSVTGLRHWDISTLRDVIKKVTFFVLILLFFFSHLRFCHGCWRFGRQFQKCSCPGMKYMETSFLSSPSAGHEVGQLL